MLPASVLLTCSVPGKIKKANRPSDELKKPCNGGAKLCFFCKRERRSRQGDCPVPRCAAGSWRWPLKGSTRFEGSRKRASGTCLGGSTSEQDLRKSPFRSLFRFVGDSPTEASYSRQGRVGRNTANPGGTMASMPAPFRARAVAVSTCISSNGADLAIYERGDRQGVSVDAAGAAVPRPRCGGFPRSHDDRLAGPGEGPEQRSMWGRIQGGVFGPGMTEQRLGRPTPHAD